MFVVCSSIVCFAPFSSCYMAPVASPGPQYCCVNYPLCTNSQQRVRSTAGLRTRLPHCAFCLERDRCAFPNCENHAAPTAGSYRTEFCSLHFGDPYNSNHRKRKLCSDSKIGCLQLTQEPRSGKCVPCSNGSSPCAHSMSGCSLHVRNPPKTPSQDAFTISSQLLCS